MWLMAMARWRWASACPDWAATSNQVSASISFRGRPSPEKAYREMSATQLIGRMGQPEEIAAAAHYLASDDAALVTGASLMADGGWSVGK